MNLPFDFQGLPEYLSRLIVARTTASGEGVGGLRPVSVLARCSITGMPSSERTIFENASAAAYPWSTLDAAAAQEIVSSDTNDTAAGTGARTVLISGLNTSYDEISETVSLNGTTAVALTKTYLRINAMVVASAGSGGVNAGNLTVRTVSGSTTLAVMAAGENTLLQGVYTIPNKYRGYLLMYRALRNATNGFSAFINYRTQGGVWQRLVADVSNGAGPNGIERNFLFPRLLAAKSDLDLRVNVQTGNTAASGNFSLLLERTDE